MFHLFKNLLQNNQPDTTNIDTVYALLKLLLKQFHFFHNRKTRSDSRVNRGSWRDSRQFLGGGNRANTERGGPSAETIHPQYYRDVNPGDPPCTVDVSSPRRGWDCDVRIDLALVVTARASRAHRPCASPRSALRAKLHLALRPSNWILIHSVDRGCCLSYGRISSYVARSSKISQAAFSFRRRRK